MITAAADGSSLSNPGPSGWSWYIDDDRWAAGGWPRGTNNMGELMAVLDLLRQTSAVAEEPLKILCDSQYVINCLTKWLPGWKRRGWKKADGKPVLNVDLLQALDAELRLPDGSRRDLRFEWVKGHSGHPLNEAADQRARAAATAFQEGRQPATGPGFGADAPVVVRSVAPVIETEPDLFSFADEPAEPESLPEASEPPRSPAPEAAASAPEPVRFDTKVVVLLAEDLLAWQELNVTAFLMSAIATSAPDLVGEPYRDADGQQYLPMLRQPVVVMTADAATLAQARDKAVSRELPLAIYTRQLFATGHDAANRAAVAAVRAADLELVGVAVRGPKNAVDRIVKGARMHA